MLPLKRWTGGRGRSAGSERTAGALASCWRPVGEQVLEGLAVEPLPLPVGEVGVLDGELGERRGPASGEILVEGAELAQEHAQGPAIGDDVVDREEEQVLLFAEPQQGAVDEGARGEIEGSQELLGGQAGGIGHAERVGQVAQVADGQGEGARRRDPLEGCSVDGEEMKRVRSAS